MKYVSVVRDGQESEPFEIPVTKDLIKWLKEQGHMRLNEVSLKSEANFEKDTWMVYVEEDTSDRSIKGPGIKDVLAFFGVIAIIIEILRTCS